MAGKAGYKAVFSVAGVTVGKVKGMTIDFDTNLADASTRDGGGFRGNCPTLSGCTFSGEQLWVEDDTALLAIIQAWLNKTRVLINSTDESGGTGFTFNAHIGTLGKGEPLDDVQTLSFSGSSDGAITPVSIGS
jgi:hypothetical protein